MKRRVAVTGASGFIGRALVEALVERGHGVIALGRNPSAMAFGDAVEVRRFDVAATAPDAAAFTGADAVVHLAGESVAGRWTARKKHAIYESRVVGTRHVVESLERCERKPSVLISASAVGYYGARGDDVLVETSPPGAGFLADVCRDWEREAIAAEALGMRVVRMRTGIVLGHGGALAQMVVPFRFGAGGPLGSGRQFVPWIALEDVVALYVFALEHEEWSGAVNAVAPDYATSARMANAIGSAIRRPALAPTPGFALRLVLGEFAQTLLASQLIIPAVAEDGGFSWAQPQLEGALVAMLAPTARRSTAVRTFDAEQHVPAAVDDVFAFFAEAGNLEAITPDSLHFTIDSAPQRLERGAHIAYRLRLHGVPLRWKTMIARWWPPYEFVDVQLHGPYGLWRHTHRLQAVDGGTLCSDHVEYTLPLWPLGTLTESFVAADVRRIFAYRRKVIAEKFGEPAARAAPLHDAPR